ncbi:hypothetical protein BDP27DRAFT_1454078 [Rhodocollybia butyracea]|uniref:Uncharacterized protein n=1 Tax=Rhodocollybia butyracea TaxID=206335 RepID=A0A9P5TXR4_9AGAR|nr:hypothetical protein BDP27DRAFT_1454078 [Rhodocollybia butyracea]
MSSQSQLQITQQELNEQFIIPITIEVFLYGIFVVLFGSSIYIFRKKVMPGMLYVIATLIFFILATISIPLDLGGRSIGFTSVSIQQDTDAWKIQSVPYYIFAIAGILSDAMMIHRCYRLWNSRKSVIILPLLGLIGICITWIVLEVLAVKDLPRDEFLGPEADFEAAATTANTTDMFTSAIYGCASLAENITLTGLMAGRVWWLERRMKNTLVAGKTGSKTRVSQSLLGPILQSGALNPVFLSIWVAAAYSPLLSLRFLLTPCALTQVFGISSTLIVLSIGIGLDSDSRTRMFDEENQSQLVSEVLEDSDSYSETMHNYMRPSTESTQPFDLKYDQDALSSMTEPLRPEHS